MNGCYVLVNKRGRLVLATLIDGDDCYYDGLVHPGALNTRPRERGRLRVLKKWPITSNVHEMWEQQGGILLEFYRDLFVLDVIRRSTSRKRGRKRLGGWLAPSGEFCPCPDERHSWTAILIAAKYYGKAGVSLNAARLIEEKGWIKVWEAGFTARWNDVCCTAQQVETIGRWIASEPDAPYVHILHRLVEGAGRL
jgi:hypothetical protein